MGALLSAVRLPWPPPERSNTYPAALWEKIEEHFPGRRKAHPVCVDIAIGAEGRGGVELARRCDSLRGRGSGWQLWGLAAAWAGPRGAGIEAGQVVVRPCTVEAPGACLAEALPPARSHPRAAPATSAASCPNPNPAPRRGFHVVGVEADPTLLARTFRFAQVVGLCTGYILFFFDFFVLCLFVWCVVARCVCVLSGASSLRRAASLRPTALLHVDTPADTPRCLPARRTAPTSS